MTEPKRFQKGSRIYTKWGKTKEVKVMSSTPQEQQKNEPRNINIEIDQNVALGVYSNIASITHSKDEFIIDFAFLHPNRTDQNPKATVRSRIIMSPSHAKKLLFALQHNLKIYEEHICQIK